MQKKASQPRTIENPNGAEALKPALHSGIKTSAVKKGAKAVKAVKTAAQSHLQSKK